ncbi:Maf family protein [Sphingomonas sp. ID0503]|uniref:Maf family protein n=1 Tax=Sphingomonas sp. ID0503 TaxID=3399691 RepID=UPI003AFB4589
MTTLVLASQSSARRAMLAAAGVPHEAMSPGVDEDTAKAALRADGVDARGTADALAELKATRLSLRLPGALVLGCDQVLAADDGVFDKPVSREDAAGQLSRLRGRTHRLISAAVICESGRPIWRQVETASLTMRDFTDTFLESYVDIEWPAIGGCVGAYRYEGLGAQLFARVTGSHFAILGLPLLPLLDYLRQRSVLPA